MDDDELIAPRCGWHDAAPVTLAVCIHPAQQAAEQALQSALGTQELNSGSYPAAVIAAAGRLAALAPAARHAWLAANLPALRAGHITLAQIP